MATTLERVTTTRVLEPVAQSCVEATARPPLIFQLPPAEGRKIHTLVKRT
jgi:hypothetical protein